MSMRENLSCWVVCERGRLFMVTIEEYIDWRWRLYVAHQELRMWT